MTQELVKIKIGDQWLWALDPVLEKNGFFELHIGKNYLDLKIIKFSKQEMKDMLSNGFDFAIDKISKILRKDVT